MVEDLVEEKVPELRVHALHHLGAGRETDSVRGGLQTEKELNTTKSKLKGALLFHSLSLSLCPLSLPSLPISLSFSNSS